MGLRSRILKTVAPLPRGCGPATKNTLRGLARAHGFIERFDDVFRELLASGALVMLGTRRGATYGLPKQPRRTK